MSKFIGQDILIYDLECSSSGDPDPETDILKIFGAYSYKTDKYYVIPYTDRKFIEKIIDNHKFFVGFNNKDYDNPILKRFDYKLNNKIIIDLQQIIKDRAGAMKTNKGMLDNVLMKFSLDYITRFLDLVDDETAKGDIDYTIFDKDAWSKEEVQKIKFYTERDLEITKKLYEWLEDYFWCFRDFLPNEEVQNKTYLTDKLPKFVYKADCNAMGWEPEYNFGDEIEDEDDTPISGGYCAYPAGDKFAAIIKKINDIIHYKNLIVQLDFSCLPVDTIIRCKKGNVYQNKKIQNIKVGEHLLGQYNEEIVGGINKQPYKGKLIKIELENGLFIKCTPEHKFPIIRNDKQIDVEAKDILETDDMITTLSKFKTFNRNYKGKIKKMCEVCGEEFSVYPSQIDIKSCGDSSCMNYLRKINSSKGNLGKTKYNCKHLMKMSIERKGKKRSKEHIINIKKATKKAMWNPKIRDNFLKGNENKDFSYMKTIEWRQKVALSRMKNIKEGKFIYKGIKFRSNWEKIFARGLDKNGIKWKYECRVFKLKENLFYLPDFYLPEYDKWVEIKGYMYDHSREKIQEFMKNHKLIVLSDLKSIKDGEMKWLK